MATDQQTQAQGGMQRDSSTQGAEMLIFLKETMPREPLEGDGDGGRSEEVEDPPLEINSERMLDANLIEQSISLPDHLKQNISSIPLMRNSVAIQANDYEIERRSGLLPARRRIIPFKFRDFQNPEDVPADDEEDEDYDPVEGDESVKKPLKVIKGTGRGRGRPRKVRKDHAYERSEPTADGDADKEGDEGQGDGQTSEVETEADKGGDRIFPRRGRPPKDDLSVKPLPKIFRCQKCNRSFSQKGNLKVHMRTHTDERPFKCEIADCEKMFRSNESLRRHKLSHLGVKLFGCEICKKRFSSNVALKEHIARHTDTKSHICKICQRPFRQVSCLRRHLTTHSDETPYDCSICGKKFSQMVYLKSHMKSHTGEKPFQCGICQKMFAHHSDLTRHATVHSGVKPYPCEVCGARFSDPSSRRRHVREHNGFKPYTCQLCGDSFKRSGQLKAHLTKKHTSLKDDVIISKEGPFNALQFQFKDNKSGRMEVEQQAFTIDKANLDDQLQADGTPAGVITLSVGQKHVQVVDENGHVQQIQVQQVETGQQVEVATPSGSVPVQILGQIQQNVAEGAVDQYQMDDRQIILASAGGGQEQLSEEMQQIIQQIQNQLQTLPAAAGDRAQQMKVAYQILHDDDNQRIVEIQYHPVEVTEGQDDGQPTIIIQPPDVAMENQASVSQEANAQLQQEEITMQCSQTFTHEGLQNELCAETVEQIPQGQQKFFEQQYEQQLPDGQSIVPSKVAQPVNDHHVHQLKEGEMYVTAEQMGEEVIQSGKQVEEQQQAEEQQAEEQQQSKQDVPPTQQVAESGEPAGPNVDFVTNPDFNRQEYYNWLSHFTELCKLVPMPLDLEFFQKISQVQKSLSDVLANPQGILTNKENFRTLMNISKELNAIVSEHLNFVLQNLTPDVDVEEAGQ